jgi:hypothetical protein
MGKTNSVSTGYGVYIGKRIKKSHKEKCRPQIELDLYHHFGIFKAAAHVDSRKNNFKSL